MSWMNAMPIVDSPSVIDLIGATPDFVYWLMLRLSALR